MTTLMRPVKWAAWKILPGLLAKYGYEIRQRDFETLESTSEDRRLVREVRPYTMTSWEAIWSTIISIRHVVRNRVPGDFVECGVWRGGQAMAAALEFQREKDSRPIWLFDTFAGMTAPTEMDTHYSALDARSTFEASKAGDINTWCYASLADVKSNLQKTKYPPDLLRFVQGPIEQTIDRAENLPSQISILRLDTDFYESTKKEMEVLYPRLSSGGVLMIDDYGSWMGARRAVDEHFSRLGIFPLLQPIDFTARIFIKH